MNLGFLNDDSIFFKPTPWSKLKKRIDKLLERSDKLVARVNSEQLRAEAKIESASFLSLTISFDKSLSDHLSTFQ